MVFSDLAQAATVSAGSDTFTTDAAYSPSPNALVLAFVMTSRAAVSQVAPTSLTGNGMTWTLVDSRQNGTPTRFGVSVWRATSSAPVSGNLTVTCSSSDITSCVIRVVQLTNVDVSSSGANAVVQFNDALTTGSNPTVSLTNPVSTTGRNAVIAFSGCNGSNTYGATSEAGWSTIFDSGTSGGIGAFGTYQLASGDQSITLTKAASARYAIIAMEIKSNS